MKYLDRFLVKPGSRPRLDKTDPDFTDKYSSKESAQLQIDAQANRLRELQEVLYAENGRALLICLQAMDAGGKDGTVRHVLGAMNPEGCRVVSFKRPTESELAHDFLWRIHAHVPAKREVVVFNRSHYEDVLIARVHNLVPKPVWSRRYDQINHFEELLSSSGTHVLKFYLHISQDEQLERFKSRLDDPTKHWKLSVDDYKERKYWDKYMEAFEDSLSRCSTENAPWFVIPANRKWFRNLAVSRIIVEFLEGLDMKLPTPVDIDEIRRLYDEARNEAK